MNPAKRAATHRLTVTHSNLKTNPPMKKSSINLIIACVLLALVASCSRPGGDPMTASLRPIKNEKFEMSFLSQMTQQHRGAIET